HVDPRNDYLPSASCVTRIGLLADLEIRRFADLDELPGSFEGLGSCDVCIYWEYPGEFDRGVRDPTLKVNWISRVLKEFGNCGLQAVVEGRVVGFIQYAPPGYYGDRFKDYPSGPPSRDSVFISCLYVRDVSQRGRGIGAELLRSAVEELRTRGFGRIEALPRRSSEDNPSGPLELYLKQGFRIVSESDDFPLVRLG
ncbi:MAG: GNAT family N-acetyltransferase, partial [Thermoplasmata archaeon]